MTTATRRRDFGAPVDITTLEPLSFTLYDNEFFCHPDIQGASLLAFIRDADGDNGSKAADALLSLFERVMPAEEYERFSDLVNGADHIVPIEVLADIINWLIEAYTERPTPPQSSSPNGQKKTGRTSGAKRSPKVSVTSTATEPVTS